MNCNGLPTRIIISDKKSNHRESIRAAHAAGLRYHTILHAHLVPCRHLRKAPSPLDGMQDDPLFHARLVEMHGKRGAVDDARAIFDNMPERSILAWKSIIRAYVQNGQFHETFQLWQQLFQEGFLPDMFTFVSILTACAGLLDSTNGKRIHALVVCTGFLSDVAIGTALVNLYGKCGGLIHCVRIFDDMKERKTMAWNVLIAAFSKHEKADSGIFFLDRMQQEGILPDKITFINVLSGCTMATFSGYLIGEKVHACILSQGFCVDAALGNAVVNMYCMFGRLKDAQIAFYDILSPNIVSWTSMLEGCCQQGQADDCLRLFLRMQQEGSLPDRVAYMVILEAFSDPPSISNGKKIHACLVSLGMASNIVVGTAIMQMYGRCGYLENAKMLYDNLNQKNSVSWTSFMGLQAQCAQEGEAIQSVYNMQQEGCMPDKLAFLSASSACCRLSDLHHGKRMYTHLLVGGYEPDSSAYINLYLQCRSLDEALKMFDGVWVSGVSSWNAVIAACSEHDCERKAFQFFYQMQQEGVMPNKSTFVNIMDACGALSSLCNGRQIHTQAIGSLISLDAFLVASLVSMYSRCGDLEAAQCVFDGASRHTLMSWTALITAYSLYGEPKKALQTLEQSVDKIFVIDDVTFVNILSACSRAGYLDEGLAYCSNMMKMHDTQPGIDHYCCIIDLLGRAGHLENAEFFMDGMPCQPSAVLWMALLGTCRYQMDLTRGERIAQHVLELNPEKGGLYIMLSNMYASVDKVDYSCGD